MATPKILTFFKAQPALETPQVYLSWEFDPILFSDIIQFRLLRRKDRWPVNFFDGTPLITWFMDQPVVTHYADIDVEPDSVYFYSIILRYRKADMSEIESTPTISVFSKYWTGIAKDVAFVDMSPARTAIAVTNDSGESEVLILNSDTGFVETIIQLRDLLNQGEELATLAHVGLLDGVDTVIFTTSNQRLIRAAYAPSGQQVSPTPGFPVNLKTVTASPSINVVGSTLEFPASYGLTPTAITVLDDAVYTTGATRRAYKLDPTNGALLAIVDVSGMPDVSDLRGLAFDTLNQQYFLVSNRRCQAYPAASLIPIVSTTDVYLYEPPDGINFASSPGQSLLAIQADGFLTRWDSSGAASNTTLFSPWEAFHVESMSGCGEDRPFKFRDELYQFVSDRMRRVDHTPMLPGPKQRIEFVGTGMTTYTNRVQNAPVIPGSVQFYDEGVPFVINDVGNGTLSGSNGSGTFDYEEGRFTASFYSMPVGNVYVKYQQAIVSDRGELVLRGMDEPQKHLERTCRFIGLLLDQQACNRDFLHVLQDRDRAPAGVLTSMAFRLGIPDLNPIWNVDRQRIYLELYPEVLRIRGTLNSFKLLLKFYGYLLDFKDSQIIAARQFLDSVQADPPGLEMDFPSIFDTSAGLFVVNFKLKFRRISDLEVLPTTDPTTQFLLRELEQIKPFNAILEYDPDF